LRCAAVRVTAIVLLPMVDILPPRVA